MTNRNPTLGGLRATEPHFTRIQGADTEVGVCRFKDGAVVLVAQTAQSTAFVPLTPVQAHQIAAALVGGAA